MLTTVLHQCPACHSTATKPARLGTITLVRCRGCGLVRERAAAPPEAVYTAEYSEPGGEFGATFDTFHPTFQAYVDHVVAERLRLLAPHIGHRGRWLDVGAGVGDVLVRVQAAGWQAHGLELVEASADRARRRGVAMTTGLLDDADLEADPHDVVSAFHVLEHLDDGLDFVSRLAEHARPGGVVVLEVPNWRSVHRRTHGDAWVYRREYEHLAHYGPAPLRALLQRAGLEPVLVTTPSYLWSGHSLGQAADDLGLGRWARYALRFSRPDPAGGGDPVPGPALWGALRGVEALWRRMGVGHLVLAAGRRPA